MKKVLYYTYFENISGLAWLKITAVNKWKKKMLDLKFSLLIWCQSFDLKMPYT